MSEDGKNGIQENTVENLPDVDGLNIDKERSRRLCEELRKHGFANLQHVSAHICFNSHSTTADALATIKTLDSETFDVVLPEWIGIDDKLMMREHNPITDEALQKQKDEYGRTLLQELRKHNMPIAYADINASHQGLRELDEAKYALFNYPFLVRSHKVDFDTAVHHYFQWAKKFTKLQDARDKYFAGNIAPALVELSRIRPELLERTGLKLLIIIGSNHAPQFFYRVSDRMKTTHSRTSSIGPRTYESEIRKRLLYGKKPLDPLFEARAYIATVVEFLLFDSTLKDDEYGKRVQQYKIRKFIESLSEHEIRSMHDRWIASEGHHEDQEVNKLFFERTNELIIPERFLKKH